MSQTINNLRIEQPCPKYFSESKKQGEFFDCKTCKKQVRDFRGMSEEQILAELKPGQCGLFYTDQLPGQVPMSKARNLLLYSLMLLSFLGFRVGPIAAQTNADSNILNDTANKSSKTLSKNKSCDTCAENKTKVKKSHGFRLFGRRRKMGGCPIF